MGTDNVFGSPGKVTDEVFGSVDSSILLAGEPVRETIRRLAVVGLGDGDRETGIIGALGDDKESASPSTTTLGSVPPLRCFGDNRALC
jgi:hypothetical protein